MLGWALMIGIGGALVGGGAIYPYVDVPDYPRVSTVRIPAEPGDELRRISTAAAAPSPSAGKRLLDGESLSSVAIGALGERSAGHVGDSRRAQPVQERASRRLGARARNGSPDRSRAER
jgi:hypothetical protein